MAEAHYLQVAPHVYGGPLIAAAALQLSLRSPNLLIMEAIERFDGIHAQFVESPFEWRDGYLLPPSGARARLQPARGRSTAARATGTSARHNPILLTTLSPW